MSRTKNYIEEMMEQGVDLLTIENETDDDYFYNHLDEIAELFNKNVELV